MYPRCICFILYPGNAETITCLVPCRDKGPWLRLLLVGHRAVGQLSITCCYHLMLVMNCECRVNIIISLTSGSPDQRLAGTLRDDALRSRRWDWPWKQPRCASFLRLGIKFLIKSNHAHLEVTRQEHPHHSPGRLIRIWIQDFWLPVIPLPSGWILSGAVIQFVGVWPPQWTVVKVCRCCWRRRERWAPGVVQLSPLCREHVSASGMLLCLTAPMRGNELTAQCSQSLLFWTRWDLHLTALFVDHLPGM